MNRKESPYIILKYASTINGIIGSNNNQRLVLSNKLDNRRVMEIRSKVDAILIGAGTLIEDNPELTIRDQALVKERVELGLSAQPTRVVLAKGHLEDINFRLFQDRLAETIIFSDTVDPQLPSYIKQINYTNPSSHLRSALDTLDEMGIQTILIEGGAKIISEVLKLGVADEIRILYSPIYVSEGIKIPFQENIKLNHLERKIERLGSQFALSLKLSNGEYGKL